MVAKSRWAKTETESSNGEDNLVVDDLRALASARGAAPEDPAEDDRARRREQVQMDFASLLFQAPTPQPRTTVGPHDAPVGSADLAFAPAAEDDDSEQADDAEDTGSAEHSAHSEGMDEEHSPRSQIGRASCRDRVGG